jgi:hypothetical protein
MLARLFFICLVLSFFVVQDSFGLIIYEQGKLKSFDEITIFESDKLCALGTPLSERVSHQKEFCHF